MRCSTTRSESPVRLDELLPALVESFRLRFAGTGPAFELAAADGHVVVEASADRLTQVFENLLDNAVSFSPPGGRVAVALRTVAGRAEVTVDDEGPGVPAEHRDRIFARFFTYRPGEDNGLNHTGLGLALVRAIVESYGGTVAAEDRHGGGTRMVVTLPMASQ
jgi:two-component system, OmpR family, sensor histidine kinase ChvG